jgi:L-ascorbate metabolism protein UlaG (beta-lactamase superfamily)
MDFGCCFLISAGGITFLTDPGFKPSVNIQTDVLFTQPYHDGGYYQKLLGVVRPRVVIPIHWDNLFSANDPEPYFWPPAFKWPPLRRINLQSLAETIRKVSPDVKVIIPQAFKPYEVTDLINNIRA